MALINVEREMSDEEYLITMARCSLNLDRLESKAWMLTAKTLFPTKFGIQFEAYEIEKMSNNCKEAAKYFSDLFRRFPNNEKLWQVVLSMMAALRSNNPDDGQNFLRDMFENIPSEIQYELLLVTANRSVDTIDHCHLMLLLLKKFPDAMEQHGAKLVETLMTAEKCNNEQNPLNSFRRLLVCDLQPLLGECTSINWPQKQLYKLLLLSIEFYLCYIRNIANNNAQDVPGTEGVIEDPWQNLFRVYETIGKKLNWELSEIFSSYPLTKGQAWKKICKFTTHGGRDKEQFFQQLVYCAMLLYIYCLYEYNVYLDPGPLSQRGESENNLVFLEAIPQARSNSLFEPELKTGKIGCNFEDNIFLFDGGNSNSKLAGSTSQLEPSIKMRKIESSFEQNTSISDRGNCSSPVIVNFLLAFKLYKLFHTIDVIEREFLTLSQLLKLDQLLKGFHVDLALYQGLYVECAKMLGGTEPSLKRSLRMACTNFFLHDYEAMYKDILSVVSFVSSFSSEGTVTASNPSTCCNRSGRRLVFIPLKKLSILQYCCKLMISTLKRCLDNTCVESDLACGHILVLAQLDWPQEEKLFLEIIKKIKARGCWSYSLFMKYIVNIDYLEEFMYLSTDHGGALTLDILTPSSSQILNHRRMSTRGVDKGAKEDFKMAMRRQTSRCQEPLDTLISKLLSTEKDLINHTHV